MDDIKIGDIVTQNENFYWSAPKFKRKVVEIEEKLSGHNIIYFNEIVHITSVNGTEMTTKTFNIDYLKKDISEIRKNKLNKLNDGI